MYPRSYHAAIGALIGTGLFRNASTRRTIAIALRELRNSRGIWSERYNTRLSGREWAKLERQHMRMVNPGQFSL